MLQRRIRQFRIGKKLNYGYSVWQLLEKKIAYKPDGQGFPILKVLLSILMSMTHTEENT